MKIQIFSLLALIASSDAGISYPTIKADLRALDGATAGPLEGLDPVASWSASASAVGCDFEVGATSSVKPTLDVLSLPKTIWGKVKKQVGNWTVSSETTSALDGSNSVSFNVGVDNSDWDTYLKLDSSDGSQTVQVSKGFGGLGGRFSINPSYNIQSSDADVILGYDTDGTSVTIEASPSDQKLTIAQQITEDHQLTPSITSKGDFALAWKKSLDGGNALTTTLKLNDSLRVKWEDGPWTAIISSPMSGFKTGDVNVRVNRKLCFL